LGWRDLRRPLVDRLQPAGFREYPPAELGGGSDTKDARGDRHRAEMVICEMTEKSPPFNAPSGNAEHALHMAILALQRQRPDEAERIAAGVLKREPSHPAAAGILGRAMMLQNRAAEAIPVPGKGG